MPKWAQRYGARADSYRLPQGEDKRTKLAVQVGADGLTCSRLSMPTTRQRGCERFPRSSSRGRVWITQYHRTITDGRGGGGLAGGQRSPAQQRTDLLAYDTDARYATKRGSGWEGYTVHLSETCDDTITTGLTAPHYECCHDRCDPDRRGDAGTHPHRP